MRWFINRNGQTMGPVEEADIVAAVRKGMRGAMVRDEAGGQWIPLDRSPFASVMPRKSGTWRAVVASLLVGAVVALLVGAPSGVAFALFFLGVSLLTQARMYVAGSLLVLLGLWFGYASLALIR